MQKSKIFESNDLNPYQGVYIIGDKQWEYYSATPRIEDSIGKRIRKNSIFAVVLEVICENPETLKFSAEWGEETSKVYEEIYLYDIPSIMNRLEKTIFKDNPKASLKVEKFVPEGKKRSYNKYGYFPKKKED